MEAREAAATPECLVMTAAGAKELVDENTIGICAILGSTFNGEYENVQGMCVWRRGRMYARQYGDNQGMLCICLAAGRRTRGYLHCW